MKTGPNTSDVSGPNSLDPGRAVGHESFSYSAGLVSDCPETWWENRKLELGSVLLTRSFSPPRHTFALSHVCFPRLGNRIIKQLRPESPALRMITQ